MKTIILTYIAFLFLSQPSFARLIPPSIICSQGDVTAVLRDFKDLAERDGIKTQSAHLIITVKDETYDSVQVVGMQLTPQMPIVQMTNDDGTVVIQLITSPEGQLTAHLHSENPKLNREGKDALSCKEHRRVHVLQNSPITRADLADGYLVGKMDIEGPYYAAEFKVSKFGNAVTFRDASIETVRANNDCLGGFEIENTIIKVNVSCKSLKGNELIFEIDMTHVTPELLKKGVRVMVRSEATDNKWVPFRIRKQKKPFFANF